MPLLLSALCAIWTLRRDPQFASLALLAAIAITSGTGFYSLVEGFRVVDSLYFSDVTLTTVGYGDLAPKTDIGKLFTTVYVLVGIGILLAFITTVATRMSDAPRRLRGELSRAPSVHDERELPPRDAWLTEELWSTPSGEWRARRKGRGESASSHVLDVARNDLQ